MPESRQTTCYRFGVFEADPSTGELRRKGIKVKLHAQPFQLLFLLLERPGEMLTREEICRNLWPDGTFVDYEHGVNSVVNRLREALGDKASNPRFVETLARRGYRFLAPVERITSSEEPQIPRSAPPPPPDPTFLSSILAAPEDLPETSYPLVQGLFLALQLMYLGFYIGALANLAEINELLTPLTYATGIYLVVFITATLLIPVRTFLLCAFLFRAPAIQQKFHRLWPFLLPFDILWALSPFLLLHHINYGLSLACAALLVYSPFAQRALVLMGAGDRKS
jgi:cholera toxin transcriptional activator